MISVVVIGGVDWCELGAERPELTFTFLRATFTVTRHRTMVKDVRSDGIVDNLPGVDDLLYLITCAKTAK